MIAEHSLVVLDCEPPHEKLNRGDVGTIVPIYEGGRPMKSSLWMAAGTLWP
jgi:hypothetical protein